MNKVLQSRATAQNAYKRLMKFICDEKDNRVKFNISDKAKKIAACDTATSDLQLIGRTLGSLYQSEHLNDLALKLVSIGDMVTNNEQRELLSECLLLLDSHMQQGKERPVQKLLIDTPADYQTGDYT